VAVLEWLFSRVAHPLLQVGTGYAASILIRNELYLWLIAPAIAVILLNFFVTLPWWTKPSTVSVFLRMLREIIGAQPGEDVRCAIFRPSLFCKSLVEVVMVTVDGKQQRRRRVRMKVSQGVAGRAYRTKELCYVPITADWGSQLMTEFGFTDREILKFDPNRRSYLCIPILGEQRQVVAILSFDSKNADTFTPDNIQRVEFFAPYLSAAIGGD
jgi:hypothetical protein